MNNGGKKLLGRLGRGKERKGERSISVTDLIE